jgi:hypothetical protein
LREDEETALPSLAAAIPRWREDGQAYTSILGHKPKRQRKALLG